MQTSRPSGDGKSGETPDPAEKHFVGSLKKSSKVPINNCEERRNTWVGYSGVVRGAKLVTDEALEAPLEIHR